LALALFVGGACAAEKKTDEAPAAVAKPIYHAIDPAFVVNLHEAGKRLRFMQVSVQVMTRDAAVVSALEGNGPPVRDAMIMLLAHQPREAMASQQGLAQVQQDAQRALQAVLAKFAGLEQGIEAVYFTDFVIQ
jgi:flagellar FliL protein